MTIYCDMMTSSIRYNLQHSDHVHHTIVNANQNVSLYDVIYKVSWRDVHVQRLYDSRNLSMCVLHAGLMYLTQVKVWRDVHVAVAQ